MKHKKDEREHAKQELIRLLDGVETVYGIVRSVSRSGMSRKISFLVFREGYVCHLNHSISVALGYRIKRDYHDSLVVNGCGMDMIFSVVYELGRMIGRELRHEQL